MEITSLTYKTFKNIAYSIIGYVWPMIFALFITPVIIFELGVKNYGIYLFIYTFLSLLGLIDIGIGTAITKYIAKYYGQRDEKTLFDFIRTANLLLIFIGFSGLIASIIIATTVFSLQSSLPPELSVYSQYASLFVIAGMIFFVNSIYALPNSIFAATQRLDVNNKIGIISITTSNVVLLCTVLLTTSLQAIFSAQLVVSIVFTAINLHYARKVLPGIPYRIGWNKKYIKDCYSFGFISSINSFANTALASLDRLIIPFFAGPSNLTYYSVPGNIAGKIPGIANTLATVSFPMTAQLEGSGDRTRIEVFYVRSFRLITIIAAAMTITAIAFADKALLFWLNADFAAQSTSILMILAVTNFILALFGPLSGFLLGLGKLKFLTNISVAMGILNTLLLVMLLPLYGIEGAAWAYLLSVLPVGYMFYHTEKHFLSLPNRKKYYLKKIAGTALVGAAIWLIDSYILSLLAVNLPTLLIVGSVSCIIYVILYRLFGFFDPEDWRDLELFYKATLRRIGLVRRHD